MRSVWGFKVVGWWRALNGHALMGGWGLSRCDAPAGPSFVTCAPECHLLSLSQTLLQADPTSAPSRRGPQPPPHSSCPSSAPLLRPDLLSGGSGSLGGPSPGACEGQRDPRLPRGGDASVEGSRGHVLPLQGRPVTDHATRSLGHSGPEPVARAAPPGSSPPRSSARWFP